LLLTGPLLDEGGRGCGLTLGGSGPGGGGAGWLDGGGGYLVDCCGCGC